jgi:hypothetical protein
MIDDTDSIALGQPPLRPGRLQQGRSQQPFETRTLSELDELAFQVTAALDEGGEGGVGDIPFPYRDGRVLPAEICSAPR